MFIGTCTGIVRATTRPPISAARSPGLELARCPVGLARVDGEHVPVERPVGGRAHLRRAARSRRRRTGRGSRRTMPSSVVPACWPVSSQSASSSSARRPAAGDRLAVAVGVRLRTCVNENPSAPASMRLRRARRASPRSARAVASLPTAVGAHHVAADRAVADEEAGVDGDLPVEPVEVLGERSPSSSRCRARGRPAACPRPWPSSCGGSRRRPARSGARVNPQLPPITVVTPWMLDGAGGRVPQQLGVVVGVRVDDAGRDDQPGGVDDDLGASSSIELARRSRRSGRRGSPTSAMRRGRPGAVDDGSTLDELVEHLLSPRAALESDGSSDCTLVAGESTEPNQRPAWPTSREWQNDGVARQDLEAADRR